MHYVYFVGMFNFREILMTASANIKTPSMDLPVKPGKKSRKHAKQLQRKFTKVTLAQVSQKMSIASILNDDMGNSFGYHHPL